MKKINHILQKYFSAIHGIDLEKFEESFTGPDPCYANKAVKKLEHIFFDEYGNVRTGKAQQEYLLQPTVLSSKKSGIAVLGICLCKLDYTKGRSKKDSISVVRFLVPDQYQKSKKWRDYLDCVNHANGGKVCYLPADLSNISQGRHVRMLDGQPDTGWSFSISQRA